MDAVSLVLNLISGGIGAILGAVIGGIITGRYTVQAAVVEFQLDREAAKQDRKAQQYEQAQHVRDLLKFEKGQYLATFRAYWDVVTEGQSPTGTNTLGEFERLLRLVRTHLPEWNHLMWRTQADALTMAVPNTGELQRLYQFHANLDAFAERRREISVLLDGPYAALPRIYDTVQERRRGDPRATSENRDAHFDGALRIEDYGQFIQRTARMWGACVDLSLRITLETPQLLEKPLSAPLPAAESAEGRGGSVMHVFDWIRRRPTS